VGKGAQLDLLLEFEYIKHQQGEKQPGNSSVDIGAYQY
jgi:hypothetical protein